MITIYKQNKAVDNEKNIPKKHNSSECKIKYRITKHKLLVRHYQYMKKKTFPCYDQVITSNISFKDLELSCIIALRRPKHKRTQSVNRASMHLLHERDIAWFLFQTMHQATARYKGEGTQIKPSPTHFNNEQSIVSIMSQKIAW